MRRAKIGDIIEIPTKKGFAYAQYTHQHKTHGGLIRVFDSLFPVRPSSFSEMVRGPIRFSTFFPVRVAVSRGTFSVVGHEEIVPQNIAFPLFRNGVVDPVSKRVAVWWFWDGVNEWQVGELTDDQRHLPIASVWNETMLIQRIESGWTPSTDSR